MCAKKIFLKIAMNVFHIVKKVNVQKTVVKEYYSTLALGHETNFLYTLLPYDSHSEMNFIAEIFNRFTSSIIPFKNILKEGMEFISLIFHIIFVSLVWQTIVAVKRHTQRS